MKSKQYKDNISLSGRKWEILKEDEKDVLYLRQKYNISDLTARLAVRRMRSLEEADEIFIPLLKEQMPDPSLLPDAEKAFIHVYQCLLDKKPFAVWGDYDVDGACSAALMVKYFRALGAVISPYIPDRFQEGYGPNAAGLLKLQQQGINDIFIVDCGTTSFDPLEQAHKAGINILIIDHHRVADHAPEAVAFINPKRLDYKGPALLGELCAGGLVFLFLVGLARYLRWKGYFSDQAEPDLFSLLDLVAFSTICDMMPLRHLNRAFVKQGLKVMRQRKNIGLTSLIDISGVRDLPNAIHMGYTVGPRINAGGRVGNSSLGVHLLSCEDKQEALKLAEELNQLNQERQSIERCTLEKALEAAKNQENKPYLFVYGDDWHEGVLGIISSHLKETFMKTSFVLTAKGSLLKGSARAVPGVDVGEFIHKACTQGILVTGGGHPMAGGLTLERSRVSDLLDFADKYFNSLDTENAEDLSILSIDMVLSFEQLQSPDFFQSLDQIGPFGAGYPSMRFLVPQVRFEHVLPFGHNNLRMYGLQKNGTSQRVLAFRQADKPLGQFLLNTPSPCVDSVFSVQVDHKWGYQRALLILEDIQL